MSTTVNEGIWSICFQRHVGIQRLDHIWDVKSYCIEPRNILSPEEKMTSSCMQQTKSLHAVICSENKPVVRLRIFRFRSDGQTSYKSILSTAIG